MTASRIAACFAVLFGAVSLGADPSKSPAKKEAPPNDTDLVTRLASARKEYQQTLVQLYAHYEKVGDRERSLWVEDELKDFHLARKPSYRLDIGDVPPETLEAKTNIKEANELYLDAMKYRNKGTGTDLALNQKRAELLLREILEKHQTSDKIADVAYALGELYESNTFKQYDRAAAYYERAYQWRKGTRTDSRLRAATIYDRMLNERTKAIDLYREVIAHDTDPERIKYAEKRLTELTSRTAK